jgi:hypothetical protein
MFVDDTDWAYDTTEDELGKSQLSSMTLTMNDFLSKSENVQINPASRVDSRGLSTADITILRDDIITKHSLIGGEDSMYDDAHAHMSLEHDPHEEHKSQQHALTPEPQGNNNLLFELASGFKEFHSPYVSNSPRDCDYHDKDKKWTFGGEHDRLDSEEFLDNNLYLSFPPPEKNVTMSAVRKAPPIPTKDGDEMICCEVEKPVLKSALKATPKASRRSSLESSLIGELDTLSGEIKSLRENLAEMDSSEKTSLQSTRHEHKIDVMKEIRFDDLATSCDNLSPQQLSEADDNHESPPTSPPHAYDGNVLFTVDGEGEGDGGNPLQSLERSIISCVGDEDEGDGGGFLPREHTLLPDFSLQDFDDELDKINSELKFPPPSSTKRKKKELRFDKQAAPVSVGVGNSAVPFIT